MAKSFYLLVLILAGAQTSANALPVCERTEPIKKTLEEQLKKSCGEITAEDLSTIKRIAVPDTKIAAFKVGDFAWLPNLEILNVTDNPFTEMPEGLLSGLPNLKVLVLFRTNLRHLPDDFLEKNPKIVDLHIFDNQFKTVSESVFVRLAAAKDLRSLDISAQLNVAEKERLSRLFPKGGQTFLSFE